MDNRGETLVDNSPEDIRWLCNLSESELDMLIRLKSLVIHRAKVLGHDELAKKFDSPTLRAVGFIFIRVCTLFDLFSMAIDIRTGVKCWLFLMEYLKGKVKDLSHVQGLTKLAAFSDCCNLLEGNPGDDSSIEELKASIAINERRRPIKSYGPSSSGKATCCPSSGVKLRLDFELHGLMSYFIMGIKDSWDSRGGEGTRVGM
ncbi:hypothetical protein POTOM_014139 [Populus tomentosa]|uniref:Uncharacterized protein n=1 Tax=Populus tomentosa TaxID=118781 RepID=A0A8X8ABC5_POPTO|nr:hypothetical protein POTOM_014139 [Populus tomentosa]